VLDWSNPGRLGTKEQWSNAVTTPLKMGQSQKASEEELAVARVCMVHPKLAYTKLTVTPYLDPRCEACSQPPPEFLYPKVSSALYIPFKSSLSPCLERRL
jgi:hypothetical protein